MVLIIIIIPEAGFGFYGYSQKLHSCTLRSYCFVNYIYLVVLLTVTIFLPANIISGWTYAHVIYKLYKIWRKVRRREIRIRKISEALSERSEAIDITTTIDNTIDIELTSDDEDDEDDYDSEEGSQIQQQQRVSIQLHKGIT